MSVQRLAWLVCDGCDDWDRDFGEQPAYTVAEARATTSFVRRDGKDLCTDCAKATP